MSNCCPKMCKEYPSIVVEVSSKRVGMMEENFPRSRAQVRGLYRMQSRT